MLVVSDIMNVGGGSVLGKTERSLVSAEQRILRVGLKPENYTATTKLFLHRFLSLLLELKWSILYKL